MEFFTEIARQVDDLRMLLGDDVATGELAGAVRGLDDEGVVAVLAQTTAICRSMENLRIVASGVAGARSTREHGHGGLTQKRGHRNVVSLVQEIIGGSRADAAKTLRLGESLLEAAAGEPDNRLLGEVDEQTAASRPPWHAPLSAAQLAGRISAVKSRLVVSLRLFLDGCGQAVRSSSGRAGSAWSWRMWTSLRIETSEK